MFLAFVVAVFRCLFGVMLTRLCWVGVYVLCGDCVVLLFVGWGVVFG